VGDPGERAGERVTQWREKRGEGREGRARAGNRRRERVGEIQASARGKGRRSRRASAPSGDAVAGARGGDPGERARHRREGAAAHGIQVQGARRWSFLPNGVFVVSRCIGASVEVVSY